MRRNIYSDNLFCLRRFPLVAQACFQARGFAKLHPVRNSRENDKLWQKPFFAKLTVLHSFTAYIHFFRMLFILSAISSWSDFTHNWVEFFLKEYISFNLFICISEFKTFENNTCELTTELKKDSFGNQKLFQLIVSLISESDMIQAFGTFQKMKNVLILAYYFQANPQIIDIGHLFSFVYNTWMTVHCMRT